MEQSVKKVVLALIENKGKLVLINRAVSHLGVSWAFPGGVIEGTESEEAAVIREAKEEVEMDVKVVKRLLERKHPNTFVELVYFHCQPLDTNQEPTIGQDHEIKETRWIPAKEVLNYFTSDVHPVIKDFLLKINSPA